MAPEFDRATALITLSCHLSELKRNWMRNVPRISPDVLHELRHYLALNEDRMASLVREVETLGDTIGSYRLRVEQYDQLGGRQHTIDYFDRLLKRLEAVAKCVGKTNANTAPLLTDLLAAPLARLLDVRAVCAVIGLDPDRIIDEGFFKDRVMQECEGPMSLVWSEIDSYRGNVVRDRTASILFGTFEALAQPIRDYLEIERGNRGGAPANRERRFAIDRLAGLYQRLTAKAPTSTPGGGFMVFCELLLPELQITTDGIEKAVQRHLRTVRGS